jgi:hypothetical protein
MLGLLGGGEGFTETKFSPLSYKKLGTALSLAVLISEPSDHSCCASWGVKGRASRVDEVDFTP